MNWYKSGQFPEHLYTRTQLRKMKLKPAPNQNPAGYWHRQCYHADIELWDVTEAVPVRSCSPAQLEALAKARAHIGEAQRIEERLLIQDTVVKEQYKDCLIEVRSQRSHWLLFVHLKNESIWQWAPFEQWHENCLKIGRNFVNDFPNIQENIFHMEGSYFFRSLKEEERRRREQLKKLPGHCPNCGEPIAALMLDCPHCEVSYPA
ncbi:MAG: hypothetical protein F6K28_13220 [Microcoleus sp. SIO2G3]|nr:hypothetical protein [Microcoleus sp. SIO2G3]